MIKKLRTRFIIISMLSVFLVLFITMAAINISNYVVVRNDVTNTLTEIVKQGTKEPGEGGPGDKKQPSKVELRQEHYFIVSFNNDGTIKETNDKIPWHKIRGMRNYVAHEYGSIDLDIVWYAATNSINDLKSFCADWISAHSAT